MTNDSNSRVQTTVPAVVDRGTWQAQLDDLRAQEKAYTRDGDALAATRRRLPMVEVDATIAVRGPAGDIPFIDVFEGRRQLIAYYHMWFDGYDWDRQCEGCTFYNGHIGDPAYLHTRDVTYPTLCQGSFAESVAYRDHLGWTLPWYSAQASLEVLLSDRPHAPGPLVCYLRDGDRVFETYWTSGRGLERMTATYPLLDITPFGRQEEWEDSPAGWPKPFRVASDGLHIRTEGRPTALWAADQRPAQ